MDVAKKIAKDLNGYVFSLCEKISTKHKIPMEDLLNVWCEQQDVCFQTEFAQMLKLAKKQKSPSPVISETVVSETESVSSTPEQPPPQQQPLHTICEYVYTRGTKKGQKCSIAAKTGTLCSKHKK